MYIRVHMWSLAASFQLLEQWSNARALKSKSSGFGCRFCLLAVEKNLMSWFHHPKAGNDAVCSVELLG
jgi:hypothetical protein